MSPDYEADERRTVQVNRNIPVYIPQGTIEDYRNAEYWCEFTNFIETEFVGLNECEPSAKIAIYPNPALNFVRIEGTTVESLQVFNAAGQLVKTVQNTNEINISDLERGVYFVSIITEKREHLVRKIVKN